MGWIDSMYSETDTERLHRGVSSWQISGWGGWHWTRSLHTKRCEVHSDLRIAGWYRRCQLSANTPRKTVTAAALVFMADGGTGSVAFQAHAELLPLIMVLVRVPHRLCGVSNSFTARASPW